MSAKPASDRLTVIILAAGKGTRMKSPLPKVLHPVAGEPMLAKVVRAAKGAGAQQIRVVVGHGGQLVKPLATAWGAKCYDQTEQLGTAHAVRAAKPEELDGDVLIMNGDHPLIETADITNLLREFRDEKLELAVATAIVKKPAEFGRIIRHQGTLRAIVEAKDASAETLRIREINTGIYLVKAKVLQEDLARIGNHNAKGEYYLTDLITVGLECRRKLNAIKASGRMSVGVNTQAELARATKLVYSRKITRLMEEGVMVIDPATTYVEDNVVVGAGSVLYPGCFLRGATKIGSFSVIESNVFVSDCEIGDSVQIRAGSYLERSKVHHRCSVGPYARLRPDTVLHEEAHIGNFVELKKVNFGKRSKAGHLSYLGDAEIGEDVNIGCGTITCNYAVDRKKYQTVIGDGVFVGSDSQFVAPVSVGEHAVIASGSTITKNVPPRALAVARGRQVVKEDYVTPAVDEENKES